ncbi:hypothetical protein D0N36_18870 [Hymenobacter lapidiphilus]|uniref:tetratricopeptide repeat protein n=1 Tax=Hymenobacter sp. CCM 8763 TaxID=2303334 RepID=UPI000E3457DE|nr:tetratricopeptide repeat protein [Hymenobacter sp. CCM 8763]RFP63542.1 hypothetical protein D0N36_18870 [Hymenobacter sp. CCM 8763]
MNRPLLLLLLPLLLCAGGLLRPAAAHAQTVAPDTAAAPAPTGPGPTQAATLRQARQLVLERRYNSAWQLLARLDPRNDDPAVVIEKADLALRYYTATDQLRRFAFRDLKLLDLAPDSLRQLGLDSLRYRFAVRQVLERLQRRYPGNYRLSRALGDYYYAVQQCDCAEEGIGEDEVFLRTITEYQEAHAHGQGDYLSYFALGYAYQRLGRFQASLPPFERSLQLRPRNPTVHLNMAFVLLELRELEKARDQAQLAQQFFPDAHRKDDAGFLLKEIEERIRQTAPTAPATVADTTRAAPPATIPLAPTGATTAEDAPTQDEEPEKAEPKPAALQKAEQTKSSKSPKDRTPKKAAAATEEPNATKALPKTSGKPASPAKAEKANPGKSPTPKQPSNQQKKKPRQPVKEPVKQ